MSEIWKPQEKIVYDNWIAIIIAEAQDQLNDWEIKFIESIGLRLLSGKDLTQGQAEKLESIYAEKTR